MLPADRRDVRSTCTNRATSRSRVASLGLLAALVSSAVFVGSAEPAAADIQRDIQQSQAQLDQLNTQAEAAAERYNAGRIALAAARARVAVAQQVLLRADAAVTTLRGQAGAFAARVYMSGPAGSGVQIMTGSTPSEVLDQLGTLNRISRSQSEVLAGLASARHRQAGATAESQAALVDTTNTLTSLQHDKQAVEAAAVQAQQVLRALQVKQQQLIQAAKDAAARRAAQARAAALAEQARQTAAALDAFRAQPVAVDQPATQSPQSSQSASSPQSAPSPSTASGDAAQVAVQAAMEQLGKPYVWGAAGPDTFDCSGLTLFAYARAGVSLPHYSGAQFNEGRHVSLSELQPGDLVFFEQSLGHMGMYIGGGNFIHAPHSGDVVKISPLSGYYQDQFAGAVRLVG